MKAKLLIVDDDPGLLRLLTIRIEAAGYQAVATASAAEALNALSDQNPDLVITDLKMADMDGMSLLERLQREHPGLPTIMLTAHGTIPDAVEATHLGAVAFLTKPVDKDELMNAIESALTQHGRKTKNEEWRSDIVTRSRKMNQILTRAARVAESEASVLIRGASGTGKELLAQAIHRASPRRASPFVAINCAAMPEQLLESELFGHEKGAFTGAERAHSGLFREADGGTLFLDEIGDMPTALQVKLLRVLQDRQVRPVGGLQSIPVDVRIISATHRDLMEAIRSQDFRDDLYYRLNVVSLDLPLLTERPEDIPLLVRHFAESLAKRADKPPKSFAPRAMERLVAYDWPGNVRQLFNCVERCIALTAAPVIGVPQVEEAIGRPYLPSLDEARAKFTQNYLVQLLKLTHGNVSEAARLAQRNRTDLYKLMQKHDISAAQYKPKA